MKSGDQAQGQGGGSDVQAQDMRTVSALRAPAPPREAVERLSDRALRAAAVNPDHSEAARAAIADAMSARRISSAPWRVSVRGFITGQDLERGERLFFGWAQRLRAFLGGLARLAAAAFVVSVAVRWFGIAVQDNLMLALAGAALVFGAGWLLAATFRRHPARLLVVGAAEKGPQSAMLRGELRPFGHVARLDAPSAPIVRSATDYRALARRMRRRVRLNLATALSPREALPVRAASSWTALALQLIANSSDAIIVDLSEGAAVLDDIRDEARDGRCVFVTLWGRIDAAEAALVSAGISHPCFFYAPDGEMQRRGQFRAAVLAAMRATHRVPA